GRRGSQRLYRRRSGQQGRGQAREISARRRGIAIPRILSRDTALKKAVSPPNRSITVAAQNTVANGSVQDVMPPHYNRVMRNAFLLGTVLLASALAGSASAQTTKLRIEVKNLSDNPVDRASVLVPFVTSRSV